MIGPPPPPPDPNEAVTARSALIANAQVPVPLQAPLHPVKPVPGVSVTLSVTRKIAVHEAVAGVAQLPPVCGATENVI